MGKIVYGIHRGTLMSRYTGTVPNVSDLSEATALIADMDREYKKIGCEIWFAYYVDEHGKKTKIHDGSNPE